MKDDIDRPFFRLRVRNSKGVKDITGNITLERKGQREAIEVDGGWLEKVRLATSAPAKHP